MKEVKITVGPVIGKITDTSVSMLIECDNHVKLRCVASQKDNPDFQKKKSSIKCFKNVPTSFTFDSLHPDTTYEFKFHIDKYEDDEDEIELKDNKSNKLVNEEERIAHVKTFSKHVYFNLHQMKQNKSSNQEEKDESDVKSSTNQEEDVSVERVIELATSNDVLPSFRNFRFACVSGNNINASKTPDLWNVMAERVLGNRMKTVDLVLHLGDIINSEEAFKKSMDKFGTELADEELDESSSKYKGMLNEIEETFRMEYRKQLSHKPLEKVLSSVPNVFLPGNNDLKKDFLPTEKSIAEMKILRIARKVHYHYCSGLWTNDFDDQSGVYAYTIDKIGFIVLDQISDRLTSSDFKEDELVLPENIQYIKGLLNADTGKLKELKALIIVTNSPLVFNNNSSSEPYKLVQSNEHESIKSSFVSDKYIKQQSEIIQILSDWKEQDSERNILVVSRSIGFGYHSVLRGEKDKVLSQMCVGPLNTKLKDWVAKNEKTLNKQDKEDFLEKYTLEHRDLCVTNNFGIVDVSIETNKKIAMHQYLVKASSTTNSTSKTGWDITTGATETGGGCCIIQ